jgi:uncharacterized protein (DUF3084 family)
MQAALSEKPKKKETTKETEKREKEIEKREKEVAKREKEIEKREKEIEKREKERKKETSLARALLPRDQQQPAAARLSSGIGRRGLAQCVKACATPAQT